MKHTVEQNFDLPAESVIFGTSEAMQKVRRDMALIASADVPVLIQGGSGTGKEIIAKLIHRASSLAKGPYVKVNCPAIPDALLESELFGYEKGAFTGAYASKSGLIVLADGGTLFLDEIGELSLGLQSKLLQVLQDGKFCRIGAQEDTRSEARVICATNRDLKQEIAAGGFREDLFYRVNVVNITLPSLRERSSDIPELVEYFRDHFNMMYNRKAPALSASLMRLLQAYHWPGNIRQLENLIKRYVILGTEACISTDLAEPAPNTFDFEMPVEGPIALKKITNQAVRRLEREIILKVLQAHHWNRRRAAEALKISYRALLYKIQDAGLSPNRGALKSVPVDGGLSGKSEAQDSEEGGNSMDLMPIAKVSNA
ncbi:MAG TPA: sigma-54 dependent transcriptional regulator [Candidatus Angelobacter sp.]|jgi:two-component system response regulator AtoC